MIPSLTSQPLMSPHVGPGKEDKPRATRPEMRPPAQPRREHGTASHRSNPQTCAPALFRRYALPAHPCPAMPLPWFPRRLEGQGPGHMADRGCLFGEGGVSIGPLRGLGLATYTAWQGARRATWTCSLPGIVGTRRSGPGETWYPTCVTSTAPWHGPKQRRDMGVRPPSQSRCLAPCISTSKNWA